MLFHLWFWENIEDVECANIHCLNEAVQFISAAKMNQDIKNAANHGGGKRKFPFISINNEEKFYDFQQNPY